MSENTAAGVQLGDAITATDPEGDALTYSLAVGVDSGQFEAGTTTGRLEVAGGATLDFESKSILVVTMQVSDGKDSGHNQDNAVDDTITVTINLANVDEDGWVSLSSTEPQVGIPVLATLIDPDGGPSSTSWQWEKSSDGANNWVDIDGASSHGYNPDSADTGMFLRSLASYSDGEGLGKEASKVSTDPVRGLPSLDTSLA